MTRRVVAVEGGVAFAPVQEVLAEARVLELFSEFFGLHEIVL